MDAGGLREVYVFMSVTLLALTAKKIGDIGP